MKYLLVIVFLLVGNQFCFSQGDEKLGAKEILELFCEIESSDQSEIKNKEKRKQIFISNFTKIVHLLENQEFIDVDSAYKKKKHRKVIQNGIVMTFTHILQTEPEMLLNNITVELIANQMENGFKKDYLVIPLSIFSYEVDPSNQKLISLMEDALSKWGISRSELHSSN